jgi:DNA polymerase elongation subunit (family B)
MTATPRILTLDLETSPNVGDVWQLFNQNIGLSQLHEVTRMICFAAKWHDQKRVEFYSEHHDGHEEMVLKAYWLLNEADVVVGWNSKSFDIKHLNREFAKLGLAPPAPFAQIDLMLEVRKNFRMTSNKLAFVADYFGLHRKESNEGHGLWTKVLAGDEKAWAKMRSYNKNDVLATEAIYDYLLPWLSHPHVGLYTGEASVCSKCGSADLKPRGFAFTALSSFQRYRCEGCGGWSRSGKAVNRVAERGVS